MADNTTLPGTGDVIGSDEVTIGAVSQKVQRMKLVDGSDGGTDLLPGTAARGLSVDPRPKVVRLAATPTVSTTPSYTAKDTVGTYMTFTSAARASGGTGRVVGVQVVDKGQQMANLDLILFDSDVSGTSTITDNAIFDPVEADLSKVVAVIPISSAFYSDFNDNSVADVPCARPFVLSGTTNLYGILVARGTPTYTSTTDLMVSLVIEQD